MFKVGDKVKISTHLEEGMLNTVVYTMLKYAGKETKVTRVLNYGGLCRIEIDGERWVWPDKLLEKVETGGNEMTAKEYFETRARMLKSTKNIKCNRDCDSCPFQENNNGEEIDCGRIEAVHLERAIEIVQKWGEEHPVKTLKDVLLEKFPDAQLRNDGSPKFCPRFIGLAENAECCGMTCLVCWSRPYINEFEEWLNA